MIMIGKTYFWYSASHNILVIFFRNHFFIEMRFQYQLDFLYNTFLAIQLSQKLEKDY